MTATNHALCGALIGLSISPPAIALPLALASHFFLDAVPHVGLDEFGGHTKAKKLFRRILAIDAILLTGIILALTITGAPWLAFACLLLAGAPDFIWAYRYIFQEKFGSKTPGKMNAFNRFHMRIQTSQTL